MGRMGWDGISGIVLCCEYVVDAGVGVYWCRIEYSLVFVNVKIERLWISIRVGKGSGMGDRAGR